MLTSNLRTQIHLEMKMLRMFNHVLSLTATTSYLLYHTSPSIMLGSSKHIRHMGSVAKLPSSTCYFPAKPTRPHVTHLAVISISEHPPSSLQTISSKLKLCSLMKSSTYSQIKDSSIDQIVPSMMEIAEASRAQNLELQLQTLGPFFRITARRFDTKKELGRAEGLVRIWLTGRILHLESMRLNKDTLAMERSIFGIGLFIGAVAIRHGYDCGCKTAELLAINDTDLYHSKLVRFYTRIGFKTVYEVTGSTIGDYAHMLVWGGVGTRMDADIEKLMIKWCARFKPSLK